MVVCHRHGARCGCRVRRCAVWLSLASDAMVLFKPMPFALPIKERGSDGCVVAAAASKWFVPGRGCFIIRVDDAAVATHDPAHCNGRVHEGTGYGGTGRC